MPFRYIKLDEDVEGHGVRYTGEDLTGEEISVRLEDGTEVQGHAIRWNGEDLTGDDTEGHGARWNGIEMEVDDTEAHLFKTATDKGEPVYVRFPDGTEVAGHGYRLPPRQSDEPKKDDDTEGHGTRYYG